MATSITMVERMIDIIDISNTNLFWIVLFKCDWENTNIVGIKIYHNEITLVTFSWLIHIGKKEQDPLFSLSANFLYSRSLKYKLKLHCKSQTNGHFYSNIISIEEEMS